MRLWSIHPKYLDTKGLVALWREGLLAKKVLEGKTKGYKHHPQLLRFKQFTKPLKAINAYLYNVYTEARTREYNFDSSKIKYYKIKKAIPVTNKQVEYEFSHLLKKLKIRDKIKYRELKEFDKTNLTLNQVFFSIQGDIEEQKKV
jgi:hypothetical protein